MLSYFNARITIRNFERWTASDRPRLSLLRLIYRNGKPFYCFSPAHYFSAVKDARKSSSSVFRPPRKIHRRIGQNHSWVLIVIQRTGLSNHLKMNSNSDQSKSPGAFRSCCAPFDSLPNNDDAKFPDIQLC